MAVRIEADRIRENFRTAGQQCPDGVLGGGNGIGTALVHDARQTMLGCQAGNHGAKIEVQVGDVECQQAVWFQVLQVHRHRFLRQQVNGNRVPRKRIQHQDVEPLRPFEFESQPRVSGHLSLAGAAILEECEVLLSHRDHVGIDFVEPVCIAGLSVRRECSDSEADDAHVLRLAGAMPLEGLTDAAGF